MNLLTNKIMIEEDQDDVFHPFENPETDSEHSGGYEGGEGDEEMLKLGPQCTLRDVDGEETEIPKVIENARKMTVQNEEEKKQDGGAQAAGQTEDEAEYISPFKDYTDD